MRIIVVGATGYIGACLLESARQIGDAKGTSSLASPNMLRLSLESPDNFDYKELESSVIFITAAISSPDMCANNHDYAWAVNVTGTTTFIQNAINSGARVVFFSSDTVYGEVKDEFDENMACNPAGEYAIMKREIERRFTGNPQFKAIRLSYVFSSKDKFSRYLIECEARKEVAEIFQPFSRAIVHRNDVVKGALALINCWDTVPEQFINFGGPELLSRVDFAECLQKVQLHDLLFRVKVPDATFFKTALVLLQ